MRMIFLRMLRRSGELDFVKRGFTEVEELN